jgi:hypothetical protein
MINLNKYGIYRFLDWKISPLWLLLSYALYQGIIYLLLKYLIWYSPDGLVGLFCGGLIMAQPTLFCFLVIINSIYQFFHLKKTSLLSAILNVTLGILLCVVIIKVFSFDYSLCENLKLKHFKQIRPILEVKVTELQKQHQADHTDYIEIKPVKDLPFRAIYSRATYANDSYVIDHVRFANLAAMPINSGNYSYFLNYDAESTKMEKSWGTGYYRANKIEDHWFMETFFH